MSAPPRRSRPHFEHVQAALQRHAPGPIDTVASCRSTEFSKSETDRNGTMYRNVAQFTPFTPTYWVFRAISGPFQGHSRAIWTRKLWYNISCFIFGPGYPVLSITGIQKLLNHMPSFGHLQLPRLAEIQSSRLDILWHRKYPKILQICPKMSKQSWSHHDHWWCWPVFSNLPDQLLHLSAESPAAGGGNVPGAEYKSWKSPGRHWKTLADHQLSKMWNMWNVGSQRRHVSIKYGRDRPSKLLRQLLIGMHRASRVRLHTLRCTLACWHAQRCRKKGIQGRLPRKKHKASSWEALEIAGVFQYFRVRTNSKDRQTSFQIFPRHNWPWKSGSSFGEAQAARQIRSYELSNVCLIDSAVLDVLWRRLSRDSTAICNAASQRFLGFVTQPGQRSCKAVRVKTHKLRSSVVSWKLLFSHVNDWKWLRRKLDQASRP